MRPFGQKKENQATKSEVFDVTSRHPTWQSPLPRNTKIFPRFSPHKRNGAVRVYRLRATSPLTRLSSGNWISLPCLPCPESLDALTRPFREAICSPSQTLVDPAVPPPPRIHSPLLGTRERVTSIYGYARLAAQYHALLPDNIFALSLSPSPCPQLQRIRQHGLRKRATNLATHTPTASCL